MYIERTVRIRLVISCDDYIVDIFRLERNMKTKKEIHSQFSWNPDLQKNILDLERKIKTKIIRIYELRRN